MEAYFEIEQWVDGPQEEVFEHFTVAEKLVRWHGVEARIEARPGGVWWCRFEDGSIVSGEILELDPPRRLVFTWGFEVPSPNPGLGSQTPAGRSRVEVVLHSSGGGRTHVRLRHQGFVDGDSVGRGWTHFLARLSVILKS